MAIISMALNGNNNNNNIISTNIQSQVYLGETLNVPE